MSNLATVLSHPDIVRLAQRLRARPSASAPAGAADMRRASVVLILRADAAGDLELLMIRRAEFPGDPWSGNIALPGGREEPSDTSLEQTAIREALEETGIDLVRAGRVLGRLDEVRPLSAPSLAIIPFLAAVGGEVAIVPNAEVATAFWVPVAQLREPSLWTETVVEVRGKPRQVRCFRHGEYVIWGLTERVLRQFFTLLTSTNAF